MHAKAILDRLPPARVAQRVDMDAGGMHVAAVSLAANVCGRCTAAGSCSRDTPVPAWRASKQAGAGPRAGYRPSQGASQHAAPPARRARPCCIAPGRGVGRMQSLDRQWKQRARGLIFSGRIWQQGSSCVHAADAWSLMHGA